MNQATFKFLSHGPKRSTRDMWEQFDDEQLFAMAKKRVQEPIIDSSRKGLIRLLEQRRMRA